MAKQSVQEKEHELYYPGREVTLEFPGGVTRIAKVYPVGFVHLQQFGKNLSLASQMIDRVATIGVPKTLHFAVKAANTEEEKATAQVELNKAISRAVVKALLPVILGECLDIVVDCTTGVDVRKLAHWHVAPIVEAWIEESFSDPNCFRPWVEAIDDLIAKMTGQRMFLWDSLSASFSGLDISSVTSSILGNPASPTVDGVSDNSNTGA